MRRDTTSWFSHNLGMDMPLVAYGTRGLSAFDVSDRRRRLSRIRTLFAGRCHQAFYRIRSASRLFDKFGQSIQPFKRTGFAAVESRAFIALRPLYYGRSSAADPRRMRAGRQTFDDRRKFGRISRGKLLFSNIPDEFRGTIAMSGSYDVRSYLKNYYDNNVYFNNPAQYVAESE